jgi:RimJ/RimL family protein N-acetyltransferase
MKLGFRRLTAADLRLLHEWLQREHVRRWWSEDDAYEAVVEHYVPAIEGRDPTDPYLILLDDRPVGFIQTYLVSDYPDYAERVDVGGEVAGVDLFIADEAMVGKGIGSEALHVFTRDIVFSRPATTACVADPDVRNLVSIRAFEKAGFRIVKEFFDPSDDERHALLRLDRESPVHVRPARLDEGERLREIAVAAKAHWGYDAGRVARWAAEGDFSAAGLRAKEICVAEAQGRAVGWSSIIPQGETCWLDDLWIEPRWMCKGIGSLLFRRSCARAKALGATQLEWEAEPHALGFYEKLGGRYLREGGLTPWGRVIPVMGVDL